MSNNYSVVVDEDLTDNRILYADGQNPSGVMTYASTIIQWAASHRTKGVFPRKPEKEEPRKPGFYYVDPKNRWASW